MTERSTWLADEAATVAFGEHLGGQLAQCSGCVNVHLEGDLGAGKTTLTRGVLRYFGHQGAVKSPTYTLVEGYELPERTVYHFDLYRLGDPEELEYMGIRDYFSDNSLCLIEWPMRGTGILPEPDVVVALKVQAGGRLAMLKAFTATGTAVLDKLCSGV
ncbi:tRNA (adenosine(37)-N6)-threonylcarbamoyltransferase complex ATPase subunit type 1 TsaE [Gilvimarinus polysaccharolyticus]|uniref:tRNA (adenosine(37)-N6)-threonylcarbamoyltransferase complex ATPase subunit type 1 TsaE n=1 Tax=Gilvimarinus polysaccharolyticus TaxID=863921 RepID=UPI0006733F2F|nr:tRNA (adenosine(37)-N6)-threonylcarbamoyltransferase complex ATPase subunit type 1 TsaE [Gilvimarinus polysaccharolyticus]